MHQRLVIWLSGRIHNLTRIFVRFLVHYSSGISTTALEVICHVQGMVDLISKQREVSRNAKL